MQDKLYLRFRLTTAKRYDKLRHRTLAFSAVSKFYSKLVLLHYLVCAT